MYKDIHIVALLSNATCCTRDNFVDLSITVSYSVFQAASTSNTVCDSMKSVYFSLFFYCFILFRSFFFSVVLWYVFTINYSILILLHLNYVSISNLCFKECYIRNISGGDDSYWHQIVFSKISNQGPKA